MKILILVLFLLFNKLSYSEEIPANAMVHMSNLINIQKQYWPEMKRPWLLAGLIEEESCRSLTHRHCWSSYARLKTKREEGAGLGQVTRTFYKNGKIRFDTLSELRKKFPKELAGLYWRTVYSRPDLQMKAIVLRLKSIHDRNFKGLRNSMELTLASYNGGTTDTLKIFRMCKNNRQCNANKWFGHIENYCIKGNRVLYGTRTACDINVEYVYNVVKIRSNKYKTFWKK